ncbi:MAG TPA: cell division protein FtsA [Acidobacteriota bacterium]|nr:cell division protein FtsA [Acidobacteriota bacterium]
MAKQKIIAAVDIGTSKVAAVISEMSEGSIRIVGAGLRPSKGVRRGVIVNMGETVECLREALDQAETEADVSTDGAFVTVGGAYVKGLNSSGSVEIRNRFNEITSDDVLRAVRKAQEFDFEIPENSRILHVLRRSFAVDGQEGISDPEGMSGRVLTAHVHVVLNASTVVSNIVRALNKIDARAETAVAQQVASGQAVLSRDERELGVVLIDIGGGTTDLAVYRQGAIRHTQSFPVGGSNLTKDVAIGLKTTLAEAERLKRSAGSVLPDEIPEDDLVQVRQMGSDSKSAVSRQLLCQILRARFDEILKHIEQDLARLELNSEYMTGVVLTGGGSLLEGARQRAQEALGLSVRGGFPSNVVGAESDFHHPSYAAVLGLLAYAREVQFQPERSALPLPPSAARAKVKQWLQEKIS